MNADPYIDESTGVLRNLVGALTQAELDAAEVDIVAARMVTLQDAQLPTTSDGIELRAVHKHLFSDIYDWAGKYRTVDIGKNAEGATMFLPTVKIPTGVDWVAAETNRTLRTGMTHKEAIEAVAELYENLNYAHPFREGNGRTQRVFWTRVTERFGIAINWQKISQTENNQACHKAMTDNENGPLKAMFTKAVTVKHPRRTKKTHQRGNPTRQARRSRHTRRPKGPDLGM